MLVSGIKSRPVYPGLTWDPAARRHVLAAEGEGGAALLDVLATAPPEALATAEILYVAGAAPHADGLRAAGAGHFWQAPTVATLLNRLRAILDTATMGTRLYVAGTEGFIGQATALAIEHGIDHADLRTEHRGSAARRVQCVHCKGFTENVTTNPVVCAHCGLHLLVRDHYSRRLAAFMGVRIDAEVPGEIPPVVEAFR